MSGFNEDQQDYMRYLDTLPMDKKCWCGWFPLGECPHQDCKDSGLTRADYLATACKECFTLPPNHVVSCSQAPPETRKWFAEQLQNRIGR